MFTFWHQLSQCEHYGDNGQVTSSRLKDKALSSLYIALPALHGNFCKQPAMNFFNGVVSNIANINSATLNGAIDIIFVQQSSGLYKSTPFHVRLTVSHSLSTFVDHEVTRFGKIGVAWSHRKEVNTEINGVEVDLSMKLDERGKAYFDHRRGFDETDDANTVIVAEKKFSSLLRQRSRHHSDPKDVQCLEEESLPELAGARAGSNPHLNEIVEKVLEANKVLVLELSESDLAKYNLQRGCNEMVFTVTTQFQGTSRCQCNVFVWDQKEKIVISDIDGTITKSDVRGMLLPLIGLPC